MKLELTETEVDKVLKAQRAEIETLKGKLRKINEHITSLAGYKAELPSEFFKAAADLVGFGNSSFGEGVSESWLEEMHDFYVQLAARKTSWGTADRKIEMFSEPFLFAIFRDSLHNIGNVMFHIKAIKETSTTKEQA